MIGVLTERNWLADTGRIHGAGDRGPNPAAEIAMQIAGRHARSWRRNSGNDADWLEGRSETAAQASSVRRATAHARAAMGGPLVLDLRRRVG